MKSGVLYSLKSGFLKAAPHYVTDIWKENAMKIGYAFGPTNAETIARAAYVGADYVELVLCDMVNETEETLKEEAALLKKQGLSVRSYICMLPSHLKVTGPSMDIDAIRSYLDEALGRAKKFFGAPLVVFGSTGARCVKEGETKEAAYKDAKRFLTEALLPALEKYGMRCVLEPLSDDTLFPTMELAEAFVREIGEERFGLLADFYHVGVMKEPLSSSLYEGFSLGHTHMASPKNLRRPPLPEDGDEAFYREAFAYLKKIGYAGDMSLECTLHEENPVEKLKVSVAYVKSLAKQAGF